MVPDLAVSLSTRCKLGSGVRKPELYRYQSSHFLFFSFSYPNRVELGPLPLAGGRQIKAKQYDGSARFRRILEIFAIICLPDHIRHNIIRHVAGKIIH